jgi:HK97 family phage major capsid protein
MKISERIAEHLKTRGAKSQALQDILAKSETDGRALNDDERVAFDETEKGIKDIDETVTRLRELESIQARGAQSVVASPRIEVVSAPKGIRFARMCQAIAASKGNLMQAGEIAKNQWPEDRDIHNVIRAQSFGITKAAVAVGNTTDPAWAGALVSAETLAGEIIELVMAQAVIGQLPQLRRVPFNVRIPREVTALGTVGWVGQGLSKPVGRGTYDLVTIPWAKAALIVVITEELARFSNPAAEGLMRDALVRAVTDFLDVQFITSTIAPVANVSPGGITNGLPVGQIVPVPATPTLADIIAALVDAVTLLNTVNAPRAPVWIMHPAVFIALGAAINPLGQPQFPTVNGNRTLMGYPIVVSGHMNPTEVILMDQQGVLFASDNSVTVDVSREASVQMDSAPTTPPAPLVSFWQQNLIGLKGEMFAYWMRARDQDVVLLTGVTVPPVLTGTTVPNPTTEPCPTTPTDPCPHGYNPRKWAAMCAALEARLKAQQKA